MDPVGNGLDRGAGIERERLRVRLPHRPEVDADQAGQAPGSIAEGLQARFIEDRHGNDLEVRERRPDALEAVLPCLVGAGRREEGRLVDIREGHLSEDRPEISGIGISPGAVHDRISRAQDAEQRPSPTAVVVGALDEPRDLDELDEDAPDPGECRGRPKRRERVVARLDLDLVSMAM